MSSSVVPLLLILGIALVALALVLVDPQKIRRLKRVDRRYQDLSRQVSDRLDFRRPSKADRDFYLLMAADPVAAENNGWSGQEVAWVRRCFEERSLFDQMSVSEIVAIVRETGQRVGTARFTASPLDERARSVGIHVHADHRNQGYGREIMAAAIVLLQDTVGPIHIGTRVTNIGMQRVMSELGYEPEPTTRPYTAPDGESYDAYWYQCGSETHLPVGVRSP